MRTLNTIGTTASGRTNQDTPDDADHGGDRRRQVTPTRSRLDDAEEQWRAEQAGAACHGYFAASPTRWKVVGLRGWLRHRNHSRRLSADRSTR